MSFADETKEHPPMLVFKCRRCDKRVTMTHDDCETAIRRYIESGSPFTVHTCERDGALGLCDLLGSTAPGWYPGRSYAAGAVSRAEPTAPATTPGTSR